ncbi:NADPH2 dehydrogenase chain OYE2 [Fusarium albosuccineum]|uniref:NADPH2 dehydrogenase chain OYE2 n=1 Tax=Fusarium albosuccineum TaxID=1237068 RepID=A0A8H4PJT5_9HYPO|nr:NADPH2 dehydrogenase chain OYE2 [Fusarium albosuccineum]
MIPLMSSLRIGHCTLKHRVVMAPMTRPRADDDHTPQGMMLDYYAQRASVPGTLLITEATFISAESSIRGDNSPGIYTTRQINGWKRITDEVHRRGSYIYVQLWHVGRAARPPATGLNIVSSSDVSISNEHPTPRPMTTDEICECIGHFAQAARHAMAAGFDGVELHGANGFLIDQFTQDTCNRRTDEWGGSIENRSRFCLEVAKAVSTAIGPERTAVRLSPFSTYQGMGMEDPVPQFTHLITELSALGLSYLHLIEPRVVGSVDRPVDDVESLDFALKAWGRAGPVILAGGYTLERANRVLNTDLKGEPVAFAIGRHFISNPDLPFRLANDIALTQYRRDTFYKIKSADGYTDYTFSEEWGSRM